MKRNLIFAAALAVAASAAAIPGSSDLQVSAHRDGDSYLLRGILDSRAYREADNKVKVERTAEERILFLRVRLHSVLEFTEYPSERLTFVQRAGDSKRFEGRWLIEPNPHVSTLHFEGEWEPDTLIPLFIIDHFAKHGLEERFGAIARLAEEQSSLQSSDCPQATRLVTR